MDAETVTVEEWFTHWYENVVVKTMRPTTVATIRSAIAMDIIPILGHVKLADLTPEHLRIVTEDLQANGLSRNSVRFVLNTIGRALDLERLPGAAEFEAPTTYYDESARRWRWKSNA